MTITLKPWGSEFLIYSGPQYSFKLLFMKAGHSCSLQYHLSKHENCAVQSGLLKLYIGKTADALNEIILSPRDAYTIEPGMIHRMEAIEDTYYFEASTSELNDVVRLQDNYGRI